jgi:hypothetical protein
MRAAAIVTIAALGVSSAHAQPAEDTPPNPPPSDMPIYAPAEPGTADSPAPPAQPPESAQAAPDASTAQPPAEPTAPAPAEPEPAAAEPTAPEATAPRSSANKDAAWLFVGGALTFLTAGIVLAYSTSSVEQDQRDLLMTPSGDPADFDFETQQRYDELDEEGRRYEILSWTSFGLATAFAAGAAIFFVRASNEDDVTVTPTVSPSGAGVTLRLGF